MVTFSDSEPHIAAAAPAIGTGVAAARIDARAASTASPLRLGFAFYWQTSLLCLALALSSGCGGGMSSAAREAAMSKPLAAGHARVCFTREFSLVGASSDDYVLDRGSNAQFDAKIEAGPFDPGAANTDCSGAATYLETPPWFKRSAWISDGQRRWLISTCVIIGPDPALPKPGVPANARFLGVAGAGQSLVYDRPAGPMRLVDITIGGTAAFAHEFQLEAGKTYAVGYSCSLLGVSFDIREMK